MNNKNIPIFFSVDDNYIPFLIVTIESIVANASSTNNYQFFVLNNGINQNNIDRVMKYNKNNFHVEFINMADKLEKIGDALHTRDYYSKTTYYRLFIPTMFKNLDKALYLDCDIVVNGDIADLYNHDIGTNLVGAVVDEAVSNVPEFINYTNNFLGVKNTNYFNAGVLLMNLKELRAIDFESKFINLILSYTFNVAQDQDYLNVICANRVTYISKVWNKMPFLDKHIKQEDINLIHYNLTSKPWHYNDVLYKEYFWKYSKMAGVFDTMQKILNEYSEEQKKNDAIGGARLIKMADEQSKQKDTFVKLVKNGEIDAITFVRKESPAPDQILKNIAKNVKKNFSKTTNN